MKESKESKEGRDHLFAVLAVVGFVPPKWPSGQVAKCPSAQVTKWPSQVERTALGFRVGLGPTGLVVAEGGVGVAVAAVESRSDVESDAAPVSALESFHRSSTPEQALRAFPLSQPAG